MKKRLPKQPFYKFWSPQSGPLGGVVCCLVVVSLFLIVGFIGG